METKKSGYCPADQKPAFPQKKSKGKSFGKTQSVKPKDSKGGF